MRARGGYEVNIDWKDGKLISAEIKNINGKKSVPVRYKGVAKIFSVNIGESVTIPVGKF
ncbi:hypothetical protein AGMMS50239_36460 [Bacteroidia bacterium]|nr:hypothetical protein AGMMS50239_36460 [Bacteroidia bacterium]